jgi:hypothetical protein
MNEQIRLLETLETLTPGSEEYASVVFQLQELSKLVSMYHQPTLMETVLGNGAIISALANLTGILMILNFERVNVITSKAFGIIPRVK